MSDFYEVDLFKVGNGKSGDAICLRYQREADEHITIHVVDGGYVENADEFVAHINSHYGDPQRIEHVVLTHPDGDHAGGLRKILEEFEVGTLWVNRPWNHVADLLPRFDYPYTPDGLVQRLKKDFSHTATLEKIAQEKGIEIRDAFQGQEIGAFKVLSPTRSFYLDLVIESEKTPEAEREASIVGKVYEAVHEVIGKVASLWGVENLKGDSVGTSAENEMSIVQLANLSNEKILLTGDAGVRALGLAYDYVRGIGIPLPGIDKFQVPHHGSRRNLSTEILDQWLGERLPDMPTPEQQTIAAMISAHEDDPAHPKNAVVRAMWHRGAGVGSTENQEFLYWKPDGQPNRPGCGPVAGLPYPNDMEE
ncbi:MAG: MBL fold metallo-hydrolase [Patescibacteria group bacterium UBA2163]